MVRHELEKRSRLQTRIRANPALRPAKMKASEVRRLPAEQRERYMIEHTRAAAREYREHPEWLLEGGDEIVSG